MSLQKYDPTSGCHTSAPSYPPAASIYSSIWIQRVKRQGPWDQIATPKMLRGPPSPPIPAKIANYHSFAPLFDHIRNNGRNVPIPAVSREYKVQKEPYYRVPYIEFEKGVIYEDRRIDLCKMGLGTRNIDDLLDCLAENDFIEQILLGSNIIGPAGCRQIADFLVRYPKRIETWYLSGNRIDHTSLSLIMPGLAKSRATNIWLKRNPLGPESGPNLARLILQSKTLRTLDLDLTELGENGAVEMFKTLIFKNSCRDLDNNIDTSTDIPTLQNLYLNGVGIGQEAAEWINMFLCSAQQVRSLYLSNNPIGDVGASLLAQRLSEQNTSLQRLMLSSVGMTSRGAIDILNGLSGHSCLQTLDLGQSWATDELEARFNFLDDTCAQAIIHFILQTPHLRFLNLSYTSLSASAMNEIIHAALQSNSLCYLNISSVGVSCRSDDYKSLEPVTKLLRKRLRNTLEANVFEQYNGMNYEDFYIGELRWLKGPKEDLRKTDSIYRNRAASTSRRGLKRLDKLWMEGDGTLYQVTAS